MGVILHGYIRVFLFYDVGEAFDQDKLRNLLGSRGGPTKPDFPRRTPDYVRFENPPIAEPSEPLTLSSGEKVVCSMKIIWWSNSTRFKKMLARSSPPICC